MNKLQVLSLLNRDHNLSVCAKCVCKASPTTLANFIILELHFMGSYRKPCAICGTPTYYYISVANKETLNKIKDIYAVLDLYAQQQPNS